MLARFNQLSSFPTGWFGVASAALDTKLFQVILCLSLGVFVGFQANKLAVNLVLLAVFVSVVVLCLLRINLAICLLILLSPFHFSIKELSSSVVIDVWRELLFMLIVSSWLLQVFLGKRSLPQDNLLNVVMVTYIVWGGIAILNSVNMLVGLAGFRFMFSFVPLYFIITSTVTREIDIKRIMKLILVSGVIIGIYAVVQFVLVSVLGLVEHGTSIDFVRKYAPGSYGGKGIPWDRASGILIGPNELGIFLAVCLILMVSYCFSYKDNGNDKRPILIVAMVVTSIGLLLSMSRTALIAFVVSLCALCIIKPRALKMLMIVMGAISIALLTVLRGYLALLFYGLYTFSDSYFVNTLGGIGTSEMVWGAPVMGQGYGLTPSAAEKLGVTSSSVPILGGVDVYFFQVVMQIGLVGFALFFFAWLMFLRNSYLGATRRETSPFLRDTAAGIFGCIVAMAVASVHLDVWGYVSLAGTSYVLGAIGSLIAMGGVASPKLSPLRAD